jgi:alkanesulfonate monooxygenase
MRSRGGYQTLDHLTEGRIGWNVVTGYLDSAAKALARRNRPDATATTSPTNIWRLCTSSGRQLEDDAVLRDRIRGIFANPAVPGPARRNQLSR